MSSADHSDKSSGKRKLKTSDKLFISIVLIGVVIAIWISMYNVGEKCANDIDAINHVIKTKGGIDTNSKTWQQIGIDGCADLSKSTKGYITKEVKP